MQQGHRLRFARCASRQVLGKMSCRYFLSLFTYYYFTFSRWLFETFAMQNHTGVTWIRSHYTQQASGEVSPDLAVPLGVLDANEVDVIYSRFLWFFCLHEGFRKEPDAHFSKNLERGNFNLLRPKSMQTSSEKQKPVENLTFQGVLASSLKSPVCEAACWVVTTMRQLRGWTVIGLCKDRSPR